MQVDRRRDVRRHSFSQRYLSYAVEIQGRTVIQKFPFLHVRLIGPSTTFRTNALIDSGATTTFIPTGLAMGILGLNVVEPDQEATGAGGAFLNDICEFKLELLKGMEVMCKMEGRAFVPKEEGRVPYVVLGRDILFGLYDITFRERRQMVVLRPAKPVH